MPTTELVMSGITYIKLDNHICASCSIFWKLNETKTVVEQLKWKNQKTEVYWINTYILTDNIKTIKLIRNKPAITFMLARNLKYPNLLLRKAK